MSQRLQGKNVDNGSITNDIGRDNLGLPTPDSRLPTQFSLNNPVIIMIKRPLAGYLFHQVLEFLFYREAVVG
jgi:hypothetical protein